VFSSVVDTLSVNTNSFTFARTENNQINVENPGMELLSSSAMSIFSSQLERSNNYNISDLLTDSVSTTELNT
jgi:hypothetical protein